MQKDLPEEISEAIELLEKLEKLPDHKLRAGDFEQAIEVLNDYLSQNPDSPHTNFIEKIKLTYTRHLLEQLPKLSSLSFSEWLPYLSPFLFKAKKEIDTVIKRFPKLGENYRKFLRMWKDELIKREKELEKDDGVEA